MNDRELLEAAAKAAGIKALRCPHGVLRNCTGLDPATNIFSAPPWRPLTDDGDALRLAVERGYVINIDKAVGRVTAGVWSNGGESASEPLGADPCAATRRAIVRAAAALA